MAKNRLLGLLALMAGTVSILASCVGIPPDQEKNLTSFNYMELQDYTIEEKDGAISDAYGKISKKDLEGTGGDTFYVLSTEEAPAVLSYTDADGTESKFPDKSIQTIIVGKEKKVFFTLDAVNAISDLDSVIWRVEDSKKTSFLSSLKNDDDTKKKYGLYGVAVNPISFIDVSNDQDIGNGGRINGDIKVKRRSGKIGFKSFFYTKQLTKGKNFDNVTTISGDEDTLRGIKDDQVDFIFSYRDDMDNEFHFTCTIDMLAPVVTLTSDGKVLEDGGKTNKPVNVKWEAGDIKSATYSFKSESSKPLNYNTTFKDRGQYALSLTDSARNSTVVEFEIVA